MATQWGKTPLQKLKSFRARKWFPTAFVKFAERVASNYAGRSEIASGGVVTEGTLSTISLGLTTTAMTGVLAGRLFSVDAISDDPIFVIGTGIGQAIWANGEAETGSSSITLADTSDDVATDAYVTLIVTNSEGDGTVDETDDPTCLIVAVIACNPASDATEEDYTDASDFLTTQQVQDALDASDEHDGTTGWAHLAEVTYSIAGDGTTVSTSIEMNRNNVVSGA